MGLPALKVSLRLSSRLSQNSLDKHLKSSLLLVSNAIRKIPFRTLGGKLMSETANKTGIFLVFGGDEFTTTAKARKIAEELCPPEERTLGLEIIHGQADNVGEAQTIISCCLEAIQTVGFFDSRKVVWLCGANFLSDAGCGRSEEVKNRVAEMADLIKEGLPGNISFVISATNVDKRRAFAKACSEKGTVHEFADAAKKPYTAERNAGDTAREVFRQAGLTVDRSDVMQAFIERAGTDTRQIVNEVEKLAVYLGDKKRVCRDDVLAITSCSRDVPAWDLADAVGTKDLAKALRILRQLLFQGENPVRLIMSIEGRLRDLTIYREALDERWLEFGHGNSVQWKKLPDQVETAFTEHFGRDPRKTHPYRSFLLAAQAKTFSRKELHYCRNLALTAHEKMVSSSVPQHITLELLLIRMLRPRSHRKAGQ